MFSISIREPLANISIYLNQNDRYVVDVGYSKFIEIMIFQKIIPIFGDPGKMIDYGLKNYLQRTSWTTREGIADSVLRSLLLRF